uniref:GCN5-related N-acetyltransferase n=1 Tax=uncultured bacterium 89 TaxID=698393 RepID=E3T695_9BACT|nr:GCN5-related N-acetyltransferase [uncultured bacterium 89]
MTEEILVRTARLEDAPALVRFNRAMALETEQKDLPLEIVTAGVDRLLRNPQLGYYVVAEVGTEIAGSLMITFEWSDWRNALYWWIQSVYIRPEFRQRGFYRRLYRHVKERAQGEGGVCGFRLYVEKENTAAQKVYETLGMSQSHYLMYEESL